MSKKSYEIGAAACITLTRKHLPSYYGNPKLAVNSGLTPGRVYSLKEYQEFKERRLRNEKGICSITRIKY